MSSARYSLIWLRNRGGRHHAYHEGDSTTLCGRATLASNAQPLIDPGVRCTYCITVIKQAQALEAS